MKIAIAKHERVIEYPADIERIKRILLAHDIKANSNAIAVAWERYSDSMCAGWMGLPDEDETVFETIEGYLEIYEEE